jgi:putative transposase
MRRGLVSGLCLRAGMSRQNYYARRKERYRELVDGELVVRLVKRERCSQPRMGGRKLSKVLHGELIEHGVEIGRDRFFEVLRENGLLVEPKPRKPKTTQSRHSLPVFHNLVAGLTLTAPNQAWASDLTYIRTQEGFMYAALITDMYSRKIVGHFIGDSLETEGCIHSLLEAQKGLPPGVHPIHHSDRGCQYCCHLYVKQLQSMGMGISMTEIMHCYENALAERVNGILKQEYELDATFPTKELAQKAFEQAVWMYNNRRPHMALDYQIPGEVHRLAA